MKPERHIWDEGSTHRAVAGKEYDEVWDYAEQLEAENERLIGLLTPYRLYSELNSAMGHAIRDFNKAIEKDRKHYEALIERAREDALLTGGDET
jgi:hypothetical protein